MSMAFPDLSGPWWHDGIRTVLPGHSQGALRLTGGSQDELKGLSRLGVPCTWKHAWSSLFNLKL